MSIDARAPEKPLDAFLARSGRSVNPYPISSRSTVKKSGAA